jgi:DNA-binding FadR family transcriptional regulator
VENSTSGHTVSRHFAALLRERIVSGVLLPGSRMPGGAELSREYGMAPQSVRRALLMLQDEGMLVRGEDGGLFIRGEQPFVTVTLQPGDQVGARLPTLRESLTLGMPQHTPLLVVTRANGTTERYTGATTRLVAGG